MPLEPKHLDYENAQFLLIGHKDRGLDKATVQQKEDQNEDKDAPLKEMEKLEHEDELRVEHLKGMLLLLRSGFWNCPRVAGNMGTDSCIGRRRLDLRGPWTQLQGVPKGTDDLVRDRGSDWRHRTGMNLPGVVLRTTTRI